MFKTQNLFNTKINISFYFHRASIFWVQACMGGKCHLLAQVNSPPAWVTPSILERVGGGEFSTVAEVWEEQLG